MAKPQPVRIATDDYSVTIDGVDYHTHEGEWVELLAGVSVGEQRALSRFSQLSVAFAAVEGEENEAVEKLRLLDESYEIICAGLARRISAWSWTDDRGEPLPQPDGSPEIFNLLSTQELYYLMNLSKGETDAAKKNGTKNGAITSSATRRQPTRTR